MWCYEHVITSTEVVKYLGVYIDRYLNKCYFDYSCSSWYSGLGSGLTKKLQILQNKVVRFVLDLGPRARINCNILDSVGMLSVPDRVSQ